MGKKTFEEIRRITKTLDKIPVVRVKEKAPSSPWDDVEEMKRKSSCSLDKMLAHFLNDEDIAIMESSSGELDSVPEEDEDSLPPPKT